MINSVFRKIANNIWLFLCLALGSLLITSILAAIPIYTDGAMRKMLTTELNDYSMQTGEYVSPGEMYGRIYFSGIYGNQIKDDIIYNAEDELNDIFEKHGVKYSSSYEKLGATELYSYSGGINLGYPYRIQSLTGVEENIEIIEGRMYSDTLQDGVLEVIVSKEEYNSNTIVLDKEYSFVSAVNYESEEDLIHIKVVGVFDIDYTATNYWKNSDIDNGMKSYFLSSSEAFKSYFALPSRMRAITMAAWRYDADLYGLSKDELAPYLEVEEEINEYFEDFYEGTASFSAPIHETLAEYVSKSETLEITMWILNAPVLVMLLFYTYMVAKMVIDDDKNEISALKCRGAYPKQIFSRYFIECGVISVLSLVLGPPLGYVLAQTIGSANGFLEFVDRSSLELSLLPISYLYAFIAAVVFTVMVLVPARKATKVTIVNHKQKKARRNSKPVWEKLFLDVILLALSLYLLYIYQRTDLITPDGDADMTVYFISTIFIFACGMLFLRIYPYILKVIYYFTKKRLPPSLYATFIQVSRNGNENRFLIMFLILTMAIGIYSSNSAGIINNNAEEIAQYKIGADIVVKPNWQLDSVITYTAEDGSTITGTMADAPAKYRTFSSDEFLETDGIESMTKVSNVNGAFARDPYETVWERNVRIMAIEPYEFSQVSSMRASLFNKDIHWYYYINQLQQYPTAIMISSRLAEQCEVKVGDTLDVSFTGKRLNDLIVPDMSCYVLGTFDYWPTFYGDHEYAEMNDNMIIMNLDYLLTLDDSVTYDLWFKKSDNVSSSDIYKSWEKEGLLKNVVEISDKQTVLNGEKSDSLVMALNGLFSMGFVATMIISFMGFLLYWLISIRKRKLQYGVLRAMGLSKFKLSMMLFWEHLMTSGVAVIMGIVIGYITSYLYLPVLKKTFTTMLPLALSYNTSDNILIFVLVGIMILCGVVVLSRYISKLKINEAVKIGEE